MTDPTEIVDTELSASHRVFGTTELLEKILLQLDKPKDSNEYPLEPVIQLFVLKRVSRQFRDVIQGSTLLWDKMTSPASEETHNFVNDSCEIERLVHLAGPKISKAYRWEEHGQSWRNMYVLHENAYPISVYVHCLRRFGQRVYHEIDSATTYADLLDIDTKLQEEAIELEDEIDFLESLPDEVPCFW
ncbi:hypothetical protein AC578_10235 [Pseudocercospora eumusae]|uniref:F-box domain-containing protein n=1 Tax=Pseudocercospora eumusae TaxID=321146 RepID=A0A139HYS8_9PEZI|nr:hypothetical protein AC578_10235 [Pseudocercospora eumusae]